MRFSNTLDRLLARRDVLVKQTQKSNYTRSEKDRAFDQLATSLEFVSEAEQGTEKYIKSLECAKKIADAIGGKIAERMNDGDLVLVAELACLHQQIVGAQISELYRERHAIGIANGKLRRLIRKMERPVVKHGAGWKIPQSWICTQKDVQGGGTKAAKKAPESSGRPKASQRAQMQKN